MKTLESELDLLEEHWSQSKTRFPDSVSTTLKSINFPCFPIVKTALSILGTLPVTSNTMCNERLSALALLYIHVEIDPDPQSILETFIARGPQRLELDL